MRKLILRNFLSPGDIVMLTAAVRDLHQCYPNQFVTDVRTSCPELWENNPYLTPLEEKDENVEAIDCHYPLIDRSNRAPYHCIHGFAEFLNEHLKLEIKPTAFKGDLHISDSEKSWFSQVHELTGEDTPFWIVVAGGKYDLTIKWWSTARYQEVIDYFRGRILFVQVGELIHHHPKLDGVIDLRGQTNLRQLTRLVYNSQGVLCGVTALMHLAAAVETKSGNPINRPCVVIAGGREPVHWEAYPHHQFIHTLGALRCCQDGGCWRSRTLPLGDGDERDSPANLCVDVVHDLPRCMDLITSAEVIRRIETYFHGGVIRYLTRAQAKKTREVVLDRARAGGDHREPSTETLQVRSLHSKKSVDSNLTPSRKRIRRSQPVLRKSKAKGGFINYAFVTVTDYDYFPGTLATVNSVLNFHPQAEIFVVNNQKRSLTPAQADCLTRHSQVKLIDSSQFEKQGRHIDAWELKAYACHDLCSQYQVMIGIDSDCLLCSRVDEEIQRCFETGGFLGGKDGDGIDYDDSYQPYGIATPCRNPRYMSTSLYFCAVTRSNRKILKRWTECCNSAVFNGTGPHPGHLDQGVLNAVIFAENGSRNVRLLENSLWSQHWAYWDSIIDFRDGAFVNCSAGQQLQRAFHCGGTEKFWSAEHRNLIFDDRSLQTYPYVWFLAMLWFGVCRDWMVDPFQYLPPESHHLAEDLANFLPQIMQVYPVARSLWDDLTDPMIDRLLSDVPRCLSLGGGSMSELIQMVEANPSIQRFVEIGSYEGGSILTLALRFANRDIDFYSVESFMGNLDGTMDGYQLPSRGKFLKNITRFPTLRVKLIPGDSGLAAAMFKDSSVDLVFIDGCHAYAAVLRDIETWIPKIAPGGIMAGDDYNWKEVRRAVDRRFSHIEVAPSGAIWWSSV